MFIGALFRSFLCDVSSMRQSMAGGRMKATRRFLDAWAAELWDTVESAANAEEVALKR